jgi:putative transposase
MPRTARASVGGICYHVLNRGNGRSRVFHDDADFRAFLDLLAAACQRVSMRVPGFCLMPNHFHLVLWPREDGDLSRFMQWLLTSHVRRHHRRHRGSGHVWQGRLKAFPIQQDAHVLTVLRYVERNPLRARLVRAAENWAWSSLGVAALKDPPVIPLATPVDRPRGWTKLVNAPQSPAELDALRQSVRRGAPFGLLHWARRTAERLGLQSTLNPRGRPRKGSEK